MKLLTLLIMFSIQVFAPDEEKIIIELPEPIQPYEEIWKAVCKVESNNNPLAYNPVEKAYGIAQIREIRIKDYNERTGLKVSLIDCYEVETAKTIFLWYASQIDYRDVRAICRNWNGASKRNLYYKKNT